MKESIYKNMKFKSQPFEDTGNFTIQVPDQQTYSQQNGLLKSMPQLQKFMSQTTRQPRQLVFNSPKMFQQPRKASLTQNEPEQLKSERNYEHIRQYEQDPTVQSRIIENSQNNQFRSSSMPRSQRRGISPLINLSPFTNSTVVFKHIAPHETGIIPKTWNSCNCPKLREKQKSQPQKESFTWRSNSAYYDRGFYSYLKKFAGNISPKLRECNSLYNRVMNQKLMKSNNLYQLPKNTSKQSQLSEEKKLYITSPSTIKQLDLCLQIDDRSQTRPKVSKQNKIITEIMKDSEEVLQNPKLVEQIIKLKKQQHLAKYDIINYVKNNEKVKYIYNDYHTIGSKGGYSRGALGSFYTR